MLTIGEVAVRSGVRPSTLRYYEAVGLLPAPRRASGQRRYDDAVLARLGVIRLAQDVGCTIAEIRTLLDDDGTPTARWRVLAERKRAELVVQQRRLQEMQQLLEMSLACDCSLLESCPLIPIAGQVSEQ